MPLPFDYQPLLNWLRDSGLSAWADELQMQIAQQLSTERWGDLPLWQAALENLPEIEPLFLEFGSKVAIGDPALLDKDRRIQLRDTLMRLHPWRKGPYELFGLHIDTEWRSDWKWDRVKPHLQSLKDQLVLDVGCGNGYHCWRMLGAGAQRVIGIDPSAKFVFQFQALKHFAGVQMPIDVLPLGIEQMPTDMPVFDTVFSMGILYHRRDPLQHLTELRCLLRPGGQLVMETLIIEQDGIEVLVPDGRYAKMRNVWQIPSPDTVLGWLEHCGYSAPRLVDSCKTTTAEQRATDWMHFESLGDFLDPDNQNLTVEGYPAPVRAIFVAQVPLST